MLNSPDVELLKISLPREWSLENLNYIAQSGGIPFASEKTPYPWSTCMAGVLWGTFAGAPGANPLSSLSGGPGRSGFRLLCRI